MSTVSTSKAALAATVRHHPDDAERVGAARRALTEANAVAYVRRIVEAAPPLTDEQRTRLAALLAPTTGGAA